MRIWIIDHYSVPVKYYPLARNTNFAKQFIKNGHEVIIFAASTVHNSAINLIEDKSKYKEVIDDGVKYVLIKCHQYSGNGVKRVINMVEFSRKLEKVCENYERPNAIISTSMTLSACRKGILLGKRYGCKKIASVNDLWPESLISYGLASKYNPYVLVLRYIEKWIYCNADRLVFSMEGAYDYIIERGWDRVVPREKVFFINNGVDLQEFNYNKNHYQVHDCDLSNRDTFKVVYTGSIRRVNDLQCLIMAAKRLMNDKVRILIWGDGDQREQLEGIVKSDGINNVIFKGKVEKKYIPFIVSNADLNILHGRSNPILRFGISANKMFDYMAAGKPILVSFTIPYNPIIEVGAGFEVERYAPDSIANAIDRIASMPEDERVQRGEIAFEGAKEYSFDVLGRKLLNLIESM